MATAKLMFNQRVEEMLDLLLNASKVASRYGTKEGPYHVIDPTRPGVWSLCGRKKYMLSKPRRATGYARFDQCKKCRRKLVSYAKELLDVQPQNLFSGPVVLNDEIVRLALEARDKPTAEPDLIQALLPREYWPTGSGARTMAVLRIPGHE